MKTPQFREPFGLNWPGKRAAYAAAAAPPTTPLPAELADWDPQSPSHLLISGDNLEALKLLAASYTDQVKLIYIDPPYNTGNDFIYADSFAHTVAEYHQRSGQKSTDGTPLVPQLESAGRRHAPWLSMMLPRLRWAWELLAADGAIFISIDSIEHAHLKLLADELFGSEHRIVDFIWRTKPGAKGVPPRSMVTENHEYIVAYAKDPQQFRFRGRPRDIRAFANPDDDPRGPWKKDNLKSTLASATSFTITDPATGNQFDSRWAFSPDTIAKMIADDRIIFPDDPQQWPYQKSFLAEYPNATIPVLSRLEEDFGGTERGTRELRTLFGTAGVFPYPKPTGLLRWLVEQVATCDGDVVMDFFAGSGTTGHAVLEQNHLDGIHRRCVLVQRPEPLPEDSPAAKAGLATITDVCVERLRLAATKIAASGAAAPSQPTAGSGAASPQMTFTLIDLEATASPGDSAP